MEAEPSLAEFHEEKVFSSLELMSSQAEEVCVTHTINQPPTVQYFSLPCLRQHVDNYAGELLVTPFHPLGTGC